MSSPIMSNIVARLGLDADNFDQGLDKASARLDKAKANFAKGFAALGSVAALGMVAINQAIAKESNKFHFEASLGLDPAEAKKAAEVAGKAYADGWGESLEEVNAATKSVIQNMNGLANDVDLSALTEKTLAFATTFGEDSTKITAAVGKMLKTGLVKDADEAFDVLTWGMQNGANEAEDLLDTFIEYPTHFRDLGLSGKQAMGVLVQGMQGGAFNADKVADAFKELSIRAKDMSTTSMDAYKALGLNAEEMTQRMANGGDDAAEGISIILNALKAVPDAADRSALSVALFGTQSEDLAEALWSLDPATASSIEGMDKMAGASDKMTDATKNTLDATEQIKRSLMAGLGELGEAFLPYFTAAQNWVKNNDELVLSAAKVGVGLLALYGILQVGLGIFNTLSAGFAVLGTVFKGAGLLGPIGLIVAAIAGLVVAFQYAMQHSEKFANFVGPIFDKVTSAIETFANKSYIVQRVMTHFPVIAGLVVQTFGALWYAIDKIIKAAVEFFKAFDSEIILAAKIAFEGLLIAIELLLGAIAIAATVIAAIVGALYEVRAILVPVAVGVGTATAAWGAYKIAVIAASFAHTKYLKTVSFMLKGLINVLKGVQLVSAAMFANPFGAVILAIIALGAAFYAAYKYSDTFRAMVDKLWAWMKANKPIVIALAVAIGTIVTAMIVWRTTSVLMASTLLVFQAGTVASTVAVKAKTAAMWLWNGAMKVASVTTKILAGTMRLLSAAFLANPIGLVIVAVIALVAAFIYLWKNSEGFRNFFIGMWNGIKSAAEAVGNWFMNSFVPFLQSIWNLILRGVNLWVAGVRLYFNTVRTVIMAVLNFVINYIKWWVNLYLAIFRGIGMVVTYIRDAFNRAKNAVVEIGGRIIEAAKDLINKVKSPFSNAKDWLLKAGEDIVKGLIKGIKNMGGKAVDGLKDLGKNMLDGFTGFWDSHSPSRVMISKGHDIADGGIIGIEDRYSKARAAMVGLGNRMLGGFDTSLSPALVGVPGAGSGNVAAGQTSSTSTVITVNIPANVSGADANAIKAAAQAGAQEALQQVYNSTRSRV